MSIKRFVRVRNENTFPLGDKNLVPMQTFISSVRTCAPVIFVNGSIVFPRVNYLRGRYFRGCTTSRLCCCSTTFWKIWVSHLNVTMIKFHAPGDFANVLIRPPQYHKICGTGDRRVNIVTEIECERSTHSSRIPDSKSKLA